MSDLTSIEKLKLEKAFQMGGGYVLDFTNASFQAFVLENANLDIFDEKYHFESGSKANRMRAFWNKDSNELVGCFIAKLIEYWRAKCSIENRLIATQEDQILKDCYKIASRLQQPSSPEPSINTNFSEARKKLLHRFDEFGRVSDPVERRKRGNKLEVLVQDIFDIHEIETKKRFTRNNGGEQLDGAFVLEGWFYIVECKWTQKLSDIRELDSLFGKVARSGKQTMGVFISINGYSKNVIPLLKQNPDKSILLMDGYDLRCILDEKFNVSLNTMLKSKISALNFDGEPHHRH